MLTVHILGLFPDVFDAYFSASLIGKAREKGVLAFHYHQLRDWAVGKHRAVDDKAYGGGPGMVFLPEVACAAVRAIRQEFAIGKVILPSPRGRLLTPSIARELSAAGALLFLCARYEGVDQRAIELIVDEEISIGDYVVSGGEIAAAVMTDAVARYVPGVVGKEESVVSDSFEAGVLEHAHYTRPENFEGASVPPILLSGHHGEIAKWRRRESLRITWQRRPDLLKHAKLSPDELEYLKGLIHQ